ncbi:MAG TPA: biliverdin-producing heme oxygenase [Aquabacterium sp.]|nr:biliverdin-producing heme oxygenase [Aquabacterium sp.]HQC96524.1 biliverdin-producing heme oxygenase [Aquabacterium sp.]
MNTGLARRLREGTWALHTTTERAGIMPALLRGQLPLAGLLRLQRSLLSVYQALEAGLQQHATHPLLAPLGLAPLARCAALQSDVADLAAQLGAAGASAQPAAATGYAAHLHALAADQPALLAAHAYVRYLGDLAGGQALGRIARQAYALPGDAGTRFFDFGPPDAVQRRSQDLRAALDALPLDEAGIAALVAEAQWAFARHARLFEELAGA